MRINFLLINRFSERDYQRFGFELLEKEGHIIEAWDCIDLIFPHLGASIENQTEPKFQKNLIKFKNSKQLEERIEKLDSNSIFILIGILSELGFLNIIKKLNKNKIRYGVILLANLPNIKIKFLLKVFLFLKNPKILIDKVKSRLKKQGTMVSGHEIIPDFILYSGNAVVEKINKIFSKTKNIISVPSFDYDYYFSEDKQLEVKDREYAVFIDEDNLHHPDMLYHNSESNVNPNFYLSELNKYFDRFEKNTNYKVLISGHPKANYEKKKNFFNGRKIIIKRTKELIKNSKVVLLHCSTSVSFAVLAKKPIIFLSSNRYKGEYQYLIEIMSRQFGQKPIDISRENYDITIPILNQKFYKKYEHSYLNENGFNENYNSIWEIFNRYLSTYLISKN